MANRYGNNYLVVIKKEDTFATDANLSSGTTVIPDVAEISGEAPETIDLGAKDDHIVPYVHTKIAGLKKPTLTLSGELADADTFLLEALTGDTAGTPYKPQNQNTVESFTIAKAWGTGSGAKCDLYLGCTLESLTISGSVGGAITYNATFRVSSVHRETTTDFADGEPTLPEPTPFTYHNISTFDLADGNITSCNEFEFSWTREYVDDKFLYNNSQTMSSVNQCRLTGQLTASYPYSESTDSEIFNNLVNGTTYQNTITLGDGTNTWEIFLNGQFTDYSTPDPDRCIFEGNLTVQIMYDGEKDGTKIIIA